MHAWLSTVGVKFCQLLDTLFSYYWLQQASETTYECAAVFTCNCVECRTRSRLWQWLSTLQDSQQQWRDKLGSQRTFRKCKTHISAWAGALGQEDGQPQSSTSTSAIALTNGVRCISADLKCSRGQWTFRYCRSVSRRDMWSGFVFDLHIFLCCSHPFDCHSTLRSALWGISGEHLHDCSFVAGTADSWMSFSLLDEWFQSEDDAGTPQRRQAEVENL